MSFEYFNREYVPVPHRGFTPIEAVEFLVREFPAIPEWTCWTPSYTICHYLAMIVGKGHRTAGSIAGWDWSRVPCSYPPLAFWDGENTDPARADDWVGVLKVTGGRGEAFLLFSFMNATGAVGQWYLASTSDVQLLDRFGRDVYEHFHPPGKLIIQVHGGRDISLEPADDETIFLPEPLRHDIEQQVYSFFENAEQYRHLRVRRRRGFLFVGSPATGKTMMVRHLVRQCYRRYHIAFFMLNIARETTDANVTTLFHEAQHKAPAMVILEDLDSLTTECRVSRAHLLAELDGLDAREGVLVIGTTNNPRQIDPALAHRPSRFDRVWHFPLPDVEMRRRYLQWAFDGLEAKAIAAVAERTNKWSFAYLNELRTTTAILAMDRGSPSLTEEDLSNALNLLGPQFREGRKNHPIDDTGDFTGFGSD